MVGEKTIDALVVYRDQFKYTKDLIADVRSQTIIPNKLVLVDNGSASNPLGGVSTGCNRPLCHIWNSFVENSTADIVCLLNNDMRIPRYFMANANHIFKTRPKVGAVIHPTNHMAYTKAVPLKLADNVPILTGVRQGWDICMRRELWEHIPDEIKFFFGDDFIFETIYSKGFFVAVDTGSPIIHYMSKTTRGPGVNPSKDETEYRKYYKPYTLGVSTDFTAYHYNAKMAKIWHTQNN